MVSVAVKPMGALYGDRGWRHNTCWPTSVPGGRVQVARFRVTVLYSSGSVGARTPYLASPLRNSVPGSPGTTVFRPSARLRATLSKSRRVATHSNEGHRVFRRQAA